MAVLIGSRLSSDPDNTMVIRSRPISSDHSAQATVVESSVIGRFLMTDYGEGLVEAG